MNVNKALENITTLTNEEVSKLYHGFRLMLEEHAQRFDNDTYNHVKSNQKKCADEINRRREEGTWKPY